MPASVRDVLLLIRTKEDAQRALAGISREMRRASATADAASARAQAAGARAYAEHLRVTGATKAQISAVMASARAYDEQARGITQARQRSELLQRSFMHAGDASTAMGVATMAAGAAVAYGLKQAIDVAAEYDRQVRFTYTQVDKRFKPSLEALGEIGRRVARDIAVPFEEIQVALFDVFSSTEANLPQAEALLRAFSKAAVAGQVDIQTASRATIGLMNAYQIPLKDVNKILDIQFQLVQEGVGTYEEWAQRIGLVTPSAVRAGQSIETMAAALAASTRLGVSAARSGTAVARAFDAFSHPKTIKNLKELGVQVVDAKGKFRPMVDVMEDWRKVLNKLPPADRVASILDTLKGAGGTIEARRFLQNMLLTKGGLELFQDMLKEMEGDTGAFARAYGEMSESTVAKSTTLRNQWKLVQEGIGKALIPAFGQLLDKMTQLLDWFNKLPAGTKNTIAQFLLWGSVIMIAVGGLATLVGVSAVFIVALASITGTMLLTVAAVLLVVGAIAALGAGFVLAYKNSESFRAFIDQIGSGIQTAWGIIVAFAQDVKAKFEENLLPPLRELWNTIQTHLLPVLQSLLTMFQENILPKFKEAAQIIKDIVGKAFEVLGNMITNVVIPAIIVLSSWWKQNQSELKPILAILGQVAKWLAIVAAVVIGVLVVAFVGPFVAAVLAVIAVVTVAIGIFIAIRKAIMEVISWVKSAWKAFQDFRNSMGAWATGIVVNILKALVGARTAVLNFHSNFLSAGARLIDGLIQGIRNMAGAAANAARDAARGAVNAVTGFLGIHSPSTRFRDIGANTIQGMINGIKGSRKALQNAMVSLTSSVMKSLDAGDASRKMTASWRKRLTKDTSKLLALEAARAKVNAKLAAAQKSLNDQWKARAELAAKIRDQLSQAADLTNLEGTTPQELKTNLAARYAALAKFSNDLALLASKGLSKQSIADLASAGVDAAGAITGTLAQATSADIQQINRIQDDIRKLAASTGNDVAGQMYNAGISAAQGLVKGLQSQSAAITKQMQAIANALVKAIKKSLGIKSPSKVFEGIGVNTAQGYLIGYKNQMRKATRMHSEMLALSGAGGTGRVEFANSRRPPFMPPSTSQNVTKNTYITVNTQEIDPRKHAAELGWELEGRLNG